MGVGEVRSFILIKIFSVLIIITPKKEDLGNITVNSKMVCLNYTKSHEKIISSFFFLGTQNNCLHYYGYRPCRFSVFP